MKITFTAHPWVYEDKLIRPKPSKLEIPEWFKELPSSTADSNRTLKTCLLTGQKKMVKHSVGSTLIVWILKENILM